MAINKKALLGNAPIELGVKDAVHVAIVSLRAGQALNPGDHITLNADREAVKAEPKKAFGIVDPFLTEAVPRGTAFWGVLDMDEVPSVRHHWEHKKHSFEAPTVEPKLNAYLDRYAKKLGVSYTALSEACSKAANDEGSTNYSGPLTEEEFEDLIGSYGHDIWYEWAEESGHEFYNVGSECCPEYSYPEGPFIFKGE